MALHIVIWLLLFAAVGLCAFWHWQENTRLAVRLQKYKSEDAQWLLRFAWLRTTQLLLALSTALVIILLYDLQLSASRDEADSLMTELDTRVKQQAAAPVAPVASQAAKPAAPATTYYPPPAANTAAANPPPVANVSAGVTAAPATQVATAESQIMDIYNPEEGSGDTTAGMDALKKRYEDILVTYFFLRKCNRINANDYHVITSALSQEMASINAPGRLQNDILVAARGSYQEMYERSSCEDESVEPLYTQYREFVDAVSQQFTQ